MPGPFPGMDPYLEDPVYWTGLHTRLITHLGEALNTLLPPEYVADINERLFVTQSQRSIYPDVMVLERPRLRPENATGNSGTTLLEEADLPLILTVPPVEIHESFIEILALKENERVVTIIEVLSHTNKARNSTGRELYLAKQREVLKSDPHLLEIDLLRTGQHTLAPPYESLVSKVGHWDYLVSLHRSTSPWDFALWPNSIRQPLPPILIPLANEDPDVLLDFQAVFNHCYDSGPYSRRIDYRSEPYFPLERDDAVWADALLQEKGLRTG